MQRLRVVFFPILAVLSGNSQAQEVSKYKEAMFTDAKLVYAEELSSYRVGGSDDAAAPWPYWLPKNVDAVAAGRNVVLGHWLPEYRGVPAGQYAPSHCGDEEIVVLSLKSLPDPGESVSLGSEALLGAAMILGSRHGPGRSVCLGLPESIVVRTLAQDDKSATLRFKLSFSLTSHAQYPHSCGSKVVSGDFVFKPKSTELVADGGLRHLFP